MKYHMEIPLGVGVLFPGKIMVPEQGILVLTSFECAQG